MKLPECRYRIAIPGELSDFLCAHPRVHAPEHIVSAAVCKCCSYHTSDETPRSLARLREQFRNGRAGRYGRALAFASTVAVVIPCHNYGRFLGAALESVLAQTYPAAEIVVVDDSSTDDTPEVAARFAGHKVRYLRVEYRHSQETRYAGYRATTARVLCFLDADDLLAPDYVELGLSQFLHPGIGIVYSDVEYVGERIGRSRYPDEADRGSVARMNYIHSGSLVLREALEISGALAIRNDDKESLQDWLLWRRIMEQGWQARKQAGLYRYRRHQSSMTADWHAIPYDYYARASLAQETVTLFVPLSGRTALWPALAEYLEQQTWPKGQIRLILMDTSHDPDFARQVRSWLAECPYPDVRYLHEPVGAAGLADRPRAEHAAQVTLAMARIYNRLARVATTDFVWIVEDDILPPPDALERLLRRFDGETASVSGAYRSRFVDGWVCWGRDQRQMPQAGRGLQAVHGNGFGCVVIRGDLLRSAVFTATVDYPAYDNAFYHRLAATGLAAKVDWDLVCEHREERAGFGVRSAASGRKTE